MQSSWSRSILFSLLAVLLVNIFHAFFLYQKKYEPLTITYTVSANYNVYTWLNRTPKYSDLTLKTKPILIQKNNPQIISTTINEPNGVQFLGLYWSQSEMGTFKIEQVAVSAKGKTRIIKSLEKFIAYSSLNVTTVISNNSIQATSNQKANGWIMLDFLEFEKIARVKKFNPLHWIISLSLFVVFLLIFQAKRITIANSIRYLKASGSSAYKARIYVLYVWMLLLPFWLIISHVLMAISLAVVIWHFIVKREDFNITPLKSFIPLFILFFGILITNLIAHPTALGNDTASYLYFALIPFVFIGVFKKDLRRIMHVFQFAITFYVFLLLVAVISRFSALDTSYSFGNFFFETVEQYWHSSYLAGFILVALLFQFAHKKITTLSVLVAIGAFTFLLISQARLPLIVGFVMLLALIVLKFPKKLKVQSLIVGTVLLIGGIVVVAQSQTVQSKLTQLLFKNQDNELDARTALWKHAIDEAKENIATGIGSDNVREVLATNIEESSSIKYRRYNAHNQYLEYLLAYGIPVLLLFLSVLVVPFIRKLKYSMLFAMYFGLVILVESYLSRQAGVALFSIWYSFFIWYDSADR